MSQWVRPDKRLAPGDEGATIDRLLVDPSLDHLMEDTRKPHVRQYVSGAWRSPDEYRDDPEGYLSPVVLERFCQYMTKHRVSSDGAVRRASDNWQKGMPKESYMKGLGRHHLHAWTRHRGYPVQDPNAAADLEEDLCAIIFNAQGYLLALLKDRLSPSGGSPADGQASQGSRKE